MVRYQSKEKLTMRDALRYLKIVRARFKSKSDKHENFLRILNKLKTGRIDVKGVIKRVKDLFKGHRDLIIGFSTFLPKGCEITIPLTHEEPPQKKPVKFEEILSYVNKIEARSQGDDHRIYESFLDITNMYKKGKKSKVDVYYDVKALFTNHEDLFTEFESIMTYTSGPVPIHFAPRNSILRDRNSPILIRQLHSHGENEKDAGEDRKSERDLLTESTHVLPDTSEAVPIDSSDSSATPISQLHVDMKERALDSHKERNHSVDHPESTEVVKDVAAKKSIIPDKEKNFGKCISELDLSNTETCTTSYCLLPKECQKQRAATGRTELDARVLNDDWVSVPSGSTGYNFKQIEKNEYEEVMFKCEDDRYELDMLIESMISAAEHVEGLLEKINNGTIKTNDPIWIEEHFTAMNLRCIERLYGDHGLEVIEALRKDTSRVLPSLLTRLKEKQQEFERNRSEFNKVWAEVYSKNHHKAINPGSDFIC